MSKIALTTLMRFFEQEPALLERSKDVLFLRAQCAAELSIFAHKNLICHQTLKSEHERLRQRGLKIVCDVQGQFDLVLYLGGKQRDENLLNFALAAGYLREAGTFVCVFENDLGAQRFERELKKLFPEVFSFSKNHCRVFGGKKDASLNLAQLEQWKALAEPKLISGSEYLSRPGIYGWDKVDVGSELLCDLLSGQGLSGKVADLGSGYGYIAARMAAECSGVQELHLYEAELLALDISKLNLETAKQKLSLHFHWQDVCAGLGSADFDAIVTNPPFHSGKEVSIDLGSSFIRAAIKALKPKGQLFLVANLNLPYEKVLQEQGIAFNELARKGGFKVLKAQK